MVANPEKAFLDVCYYEYKGKTFSFSPDQDVRVEDLDRETLQQYL